MPDPTLTYDNPLLTFAKGHAQAGLVDCAADSADDALGEWISKNGLLEVNPLYNHRDASFLAGHAARDAEVEALKQQVNAWSHSGIREMLTAAVPSAGLESSLNQCAVHAIRELKAERTLADELAGALKEVPSLGDLIRMRTDFDRDKSEGPNIAHEQSTLIFKRCADALARYRAQKEAR